MKSVTWEPRRWLIWWGVCCASIRNWVQTPSTQHQLLVTGEVLLNFKTFSGVGGVRVWGARDTVWSGWQAHCFVRSLLSWRVGNPVEGGSVDRWIDISAQGGKLKQKKGTWVMLAVGLDWLKMPPQAGVGQETQCPGICEGNQGTGQEARLASETFAWRMLSCGDWLRPLVSVDSCLSVPWPAI